MPGGFAIVPPSILGIIRMTMADDTYDFIVTGAGSAGCAVAGRLSESGRYRVLLLEAGGRDSYPWIHIPLGYTKTFANPRYNWMFESEPEKELNNRTLYQPRGKVLGGTSSINGMVYMRGTSTDYDGWRQRGCEGWDWDSVLPFFKKAEDQERGPDDFHGVGGPLHVSNPVRTPLGDAMVKASIEAGIPANNDFNGARQEGVGYYQTTTTNRRRWSSARAYLGPARGRRNLTVATNAHATRILFEGGRAVGVRVQGPGEEPRDVRAKVVVDASGQSTMLQNRFKLRVWDPVLNKGAIWTYWENAYRDTGRDEGATLVIQTPNKQGWWWYIPQHDNIVSLGVVAPFDYLFKGRGSHEQTYNEELEKTPVLKDRLAKAKHVTGYFATKDYSYRSKVVAGDGWVLVGDAFGFLDPLYSSGVLLALKSGELAADAIVEGLGRGDTSSAQLGKWGPLFNRGVDRMRRLVCEYYDGFSFGRFVKTFPQLKGLVTDLLIGDLFTDRVDAVWEPMESLYPPGKATLSGWEAGTPAENAENKVNELWLPEGPLRV